MPTMTQFVHRYSTGEGSGLVLHWPPDAIVVTDGDFVRVVGESAIARRLRMTIARSFMPGRPEDVLAELTHRVGIGYALPVPEILDLPIHIAYARLRETHGAQDDRDGSPHRVCSAHAQPRAAESGQ